MAGDPDDMDACSVRTGDSMEGFILEEVESDESPLVSGLPKLLAQTVLLEDAISNATDESQWLVVDQDGGELLEEVGTSSDSDRESEVVAKNDVLQSHPDHVHVQASAMILWSNRIQIPKDEYADLHEDVCGDVTTDWAVALQEFPAVSSIFCLGRIVVRARPYVCHAVPAMVRAVVANDGKHEWPEGTALRIVAGNSFGLDALPCGGLPPCCAAELLLDLSVPTVEPSGPTFGTRSAWVLTDGYGQPFGPVLTVEVVWEESVRVVSSGA